MKEDGFQLDPAPVLPKALPKGSAKLVARGSSPAVATRPPLAAGLAPYGAVVLPADTRSPQLAQSLSTLSLSPKLVPRGTTGTGGRHRWSPATGQSKDQLEELLEPPKLVITEQPKQRGMRFRYECEGRSAGSILGESSTDASKTLPAIELLNCQAIPEVKVTACLVWKDWPYRVHPHGLVGKDCSNGLCEVVLKPQTNPKHSFSNLGIQCVKKKEIEAAIEKKLQLGIDPFKAGSLKNHQEVDMNVVRICFQASYKDGSGQTRQLSPVLSEPIFDKKSTNTSELRICRMNKESGPCTGGEELYLLCDKVQKEDIAVVFRKETWEARADFSQADVHRQVAIVFKTPPYQHLELAEPVEVEVFLQRLTDSVCSEAFRFTYLPTDHDAYGVNVKRKRGMPDVLEELSGSDPYGIEAKRRKKPPGYMDHFAPLPAAGGSRGGMDTVRGTRVGVPRRHPRLEPEQGSEEPPQRVGDVSRSLLGLGVSPGTFSLPPPVVWVTPRLGDAPWTPLSPRDHPPNLGKVLGDPHGPRVTPRVGRGPQAPPQPWVLSSVPWVPHGFGVTPEVGRVPQSPPPNVKWVPPGLGEVPKPPMAPGSPLHCWERSLKPPQPWGHP
uniref:RELB proto-oncogene, NF-kB subunit n=1 Tax=Calidris pygmaea TaxID=425635 RepID=A0A8C3IZV3_9CHAR